MQPDHTSPALPHTPEQLFAGFRAVSLDELNAKAAMLERLDNKYVVRGPVLAEAAAELSAHFDVLEIDGRRAFRYETCYFDDPERHSYHDHHQGRRQRMKVRVRHYADAGLCFVEVKLKDKRGMTVKKRMPYDPRKYGLLDADALAHVQRAHQALYGRPFERVLEPSLRMSYRRVTLVAREGGERMTIDSDIRFLAGPDDFGPEPGVFIVEAKSAHGHGLADAILRRHHQHPTNACSKYCVGLSVVGEVQKYNRFRPALRKLGTWPPAEARRAA